jgi:two-component system OmpR family sensor kinase
MASLRRRPVRIRLAIFSGMLTAVILIGFAAVVGRLVSNRIEADFRNEVRDAAAELSLRTQIFATPSGELAYDGPNLGLVATANDATIRIVDRFGNPLDLREVGLDPDQAPPLGAPDEEEGMRTVGGLRVVDARIEFNNSLAGPLFIQYARSPTGVNATIDRLWLFLAGGVVIGTLLAGFAGMTVAQRAMRPIADLTGTARTIARTRDPSMRIAEPETDDEVAELARTLDEMLRELDAARSETEHTIRRQREFVADASHELRTPLTSILANLELLDTALQRAPEDERAAARSALRSSRRMSRLVADLLILARADAGRHEDPVDCDLSGIVAEAFEEVRPVAEGHNLEADIDPETRLLGSPDGLHRMVLNLLENAMRHTPDGTTISVRLLRDDGRATVEVSDDGPGLPPGMESEVFDRFVRGDGPADRTGANGRGTGLGLSIVRAVARAHGGEVEAGPSIEGGARFTVTLPLSSAAPQG